MFPSLMTEINFFFATAVISSFFFCAIAMLLDVSRRGKPNQTRSMFISDLGCAITYLGLSVWFLYNQLKFYEDLATGMPPDPDMLAHLTSWKPIPYALFFLVGYYVLMFLVLFVMDKFFLFDTPAAMIRRGFRRLKNWRIRRTCQS